MLHKNIMLFSPKPDVLPINTVIHVEVAFITEKYVWEPIRFRNDLLRCPTAKTQSLVSM